MPAFLDNRYLPLEECCLSPLDRGFLFGDAVYEVIAVYDNIPFETDKHLDRLARSLRGSGIPDPHTRDEWKAIFNRLIDAEPTASFGLYVHISRGVANRDLGITDELKPIVFAMTMPYTKPAPAKAVKVVTLDDPRWQRCDIKTTSLMGNVLARRIARERGCDDAIMVRDGEVTEAAAANVFAVRGDTLHTPPNSERLLAGITREVILEIAAEQNVAVEQHAFGTDLLFEADEIWLSSSTKEITAVKEIDGRVVGDGETYPWQTRFNGWLAARARRG